METDSKLGNFRSEASEPRRLPFVIEKTIHNILFIKTHMQRQDEFDAVMPMAIMVMIKNSDDGVTIPVYGSFELASLGSELKLWLVISSGNPYPRHSLLFCYILNKVLKRLFTR